MMRARGAALVGLAVLIGSCRPVGPMTVLREALPSEEPTVRVGVRVDTSAVSVSADAPYELAVGGATVARAAADAEWTISADDRGRIVGRGPDGERIGPADAPVRIRARGGADIRIADRPYRGTALVRAAAPGRVTAINVLALEDYLLGVVPAEIPTGEIEAVKAQAVAARTYAIRHLDGRESLGFDFYATVSDQVYGGRGEEDPVASRAVRETRGEILTYGKQPIQAFYHSTCGGHTAAVEEVWTHPPAPYLRSVSDEVPGTDRHYCDISNRFRWSESWSREELDAILSETLAAHAGTTPDRIGEIRSLEVLERTTSGRVRTLRIRTAGGGEYDVHGDSTRRILRPEPGRLLNSALFSLEVARDADGRIRHVHAGGGGWGHGIGMCQMGAIGRASTGQDYRQILGVYYRDTEVTDLY